MANSLGISDQEYAQLGFYASLTGQTPEQYVTSRATQLPVSQQTQAPSNWSVANPPAPTPNGWLNISEQQIRDNAAANQGAVNNLNGWNTNVTGANAASLNQIGSLIGQQGLADQQYVQQSQGLTNQLGGLASGANAFDWGALGNYQSSLSGINASNQGYLSNLGGQYQSLMPQLTSSLAPNYLTSQAAGAYADPNSIAAQNQAMGFLSGAMGGSLNYQSQGAQAYADVNDVNNERTAANALQGVANGDKDVNFWGLPGVFDLQSAAQGGLNIDINNLQGGRDLYDASVGSKDVSLPDIDGMRDLRLAYQGSQDVDFANLPGISDLYGAYHGNQDVHVGQEDPGAYAASQEALAKYQGLLDPKVTSAEEFIYKQSQMKQEQDERANREALSTDLRQRGLSGSGMEVGQAALAGQQTSQNRLLADLGAQAQAVQRSMDALAGYSSLSSVMSGQANNVAQQNASNRLNALGQYTGLATDVSQQNASNRLNALGQYTGISSNVAQNNKDRQMAALQQYAGLQTQLESGNSDRRLDAEKYFTGLGADVGTANMNRQAQAQAQASNAYSNLRNEGFDESYKRGLAADDASANNQRTQLQGGIAYGDLASTQRDQSFNEAYKRGTAADQTNQFNELNRVDVTKYNQNYAQQERDAAWNRTSQYTQLGLQGNSQIAQNLDSSYTAGRLTNDSTFNRNQSVLGMQDLTNARQNTASTKTTDRNILQQNQVINNNNDYWSRMAQTTPLQIGNNNSLTAGVVGLNGQRAGGAAAQTASDYALAIAGQNPNDDVISQFLGGTGPFSNKKS